MGEFLGGGGVAFRLLATLAFVVVVACFAAAAGRVESREEVDK